LGATAHLALVIVAQDPDSEEVFLISPISLQSSLRSICGGIMLLGKYICVEVGNPDLAFLGAA
jgi:hypothetical protein